MISEIPLFLSLLLDALSHTLCPAMLSQWFLTDVIRRTTEAARCIFDYCLSPSCCTTLSKRARSLSRIVQSTAMLASLSTGFESALGNLIYRLLLHMIQEGPRSGWETVDSALRQVFKTPHHILHVGQNIVTALDVLRTESWGDSGKELRVGVRRSSLLINASLYLPVVNGVVYPTLPATAGCALPSSSQNSHTNQL